MDMLKSLREALSRVNMWLYFYFPLIAAFTYILTWVFYRSNLINDDAIVNLWVEMVGILLTVALVDASQNDNDKGVKKLLEAVKKVNVSQNHNDADIKNLIEVVKKLEAKIDTLSGTDKLHS